MRQTMVGRWSVGIVVIGLLVAGCDSGGGENEGDLSQEAMEDVSDMMARVSDVLSSIGSVGIGFGKAPSERVVATERPAAAAVLDQVYDCNGGGSVVYDERLLESNETTTRYEMTTTFNDCEGINGELLYSGAVSYEVTETAFNYSMVFAMDGTLTEACELSYDGYGVDMTLSGETYEAVFHGGFSGICGSESFSCSFDGVSMSLSEEDDYEVDEDLLSGHCG